MKDEKNVIINIKTTLKSKFENDIHKMQKQFHENEINYDN